MTTTLNRRARHVRLALIALAIMPALALLAAFGFVMIGGLPGVQLTGDLMAMLAALPVITAYACAAICMAVGFNNLYCWEPCRDLEANWHGLALAGDAHAKWLLVRNDLRWAALLLLSGAFFWPAR